MSEPKSRFARRYDREFKENAVALVLQGRSQGEVSRDLGVSAWSLGEWVKQARAGQALRHPKTLDAESAQERELRRLRAEVEYLRAQRDILKKGVGHLLGPGARQRFTVMEKLRHQYPVGALTDALEVSKSGFHAHCHKPRRPRRQRDAALRPRIAGSFARSRKTYGARRVRADLRDLGERCGKNRIGRLMREQGLRAAQKRRFRPKTTDSRHPHRIAQNWLA